jgi:hypothetical protein
VSRKLRPKQGLRATARRAILCSTLSPRSPAAERRSSRSKGNDEAWLSAPLPFGSCPELSSPLGSLRPPGSRRVVVVRPERRRTLRRSAPPTNHAWRQAPTASFGSEEGGRDGAQCQVRCGSRGIGTALLPFPPHSRPARLYGIAVCT